MTRTARSASSMVKDRPFLQRLNRAPVRWTARSWFVLSRLSTSGAPGPSMAAVGLHGANFFAGLSASVRRFP